MSQRRALPLLLLLAGCGGGGGPSSSTPAVLSRLTVAWPARSRAVNAPSSALQATFILGPDDDPVATLTCLRPQGAAAVTRTYPFARDIPAGDYRMMGSFNAARDDSYSNVGYVSASLHVAADGTIQAEDGSPLGDIDAAGDPVDHVVVAADQTVAVGATRDLAITAYNANDGPLVLDPGAIFVRLASGGALRVNPNSSVTGVSVGTATVVATVDGVASSETTVAVTAAP